MSYAVLSVKLCELGDQLSQLNSRIRLSETADHERLWQEIQAMRRECAEAELTLQEKLRMSRAEIVAVLADLYGEVDRSIRKAKTALQEKMSACDNLEDASEEKILLAEYGLDFALQAANRALLLSMEAIDTQFVGREERRRPS